MRINVERILDYVWSAQPRGASNAQIRIGAGVKSHAQVYVLTQDLQRSGKIQARQSEREWIFFLNESPEELLQSLGKVAPHTPAPSFTEKDFEDLAQQVFSQRLSVPLTQGEVPGIPKSFALVSPNGEVVGDAKLYAFAGAYHLPLAKFSTIAEIVWLLEKVPAKRKLLVFGNDIEIPQMWLARYGSLRGSVEFYFLTEDGVIIDLTSIAPP